MEFRARAVTWDDIEKWCGLVRDQIIGKFAPDVIIGLSRGGLVPARILSDSLWIKDLLSIKTEHWGITATRNGQAMLKDPGSMNLHGRKVLIVDDITDTGQSMILANDFVIKQGPAEIKTATMLHINRSKFIPDYYGELVTQEKWTWFIFPWNIYEDLDNLLGKVMVRESTPQEIKSMLVESFDLHLEPGFLNRILNDLARFGKLKSDSGRYSKIKSSA